MAGWSNFSYKKLFSHTVLVEVAVPDILDPEQPNMNSHTVCAALGVSKWGILIGDGVHLERGLEVLAPSPNSSQPSPGQASPAEPRPSQPSHNYEEIHETTFENA